MKFEILEEDKNTNARMGELIINGKKVRTPCFWLGLRVYAKPNPLDYFDLRTILVNAYEMLQNIGCQDSIHKLLRTNAVIMMDSGGFQLMKNGNLSINAEDILKIYRRTRPDIGVVLDYPLNPENIRERQERWKKTVENTKFMLDNAGDVVLMPVVHGYTLDELIEACRDVKKIADPKIVGIGSLVPLIKNINRETGIKYIKRAITVVRREFPDSFIHVFGIGSTITMHLMFSFGADSVDSMAWRMKAAYGAIQLPGIGDRFISPNGKKRKKLIEEHLLEECSCPICVGKTLEERKIALSNSIPNAFTNRAIHNAYVFIKEHENFLRSFEEGCLEDFLNKRLESLSGKRE